MGTITIDQISSMNMVYNRYTLDYFLESTVRLGFKSFELWAGYPQFCNYDSNVPKVSEIRRKVEESGLKISCLTGEQAIYAVNMASRDKKIQDASIDYFSTLVRQAGELGIDKYLMSIGWGYYDESQDESWKRGCDAGAKVLRVAEESGVHIVWEVMPNYTTNLINGLETSKRIMHDLDSDYSRLCVDTCAIGVAGETLEPYFKELRDKVYHIHLNDGSPDGWLTWGDGSQDVNVHLDTLAKYDYTDTISLELGEPSYMIDPEAAVRRGREYLMQHLPYTV